MTKHAPATLPGARAGTLVVRGCQPTNNPAHASASQRRQERASLPTGLARSISLALGEPVRVEEINYGGGRTLFVEPLRFHRLIANGRARVKISPVHVGSSGEQSPPSQPHKT